MPNLVWGNESTNVRGREFNEYLVSNNLNIINSFGEYNFISTIGKSIIDFILINDHDFFNSATAFVDNGGKGVDHFNVVVDLNVNCDNYDFSFSSHKFNTRKCDWQKFEINMQNNKFILNEIPNLIDTKSKADLSVKKITHFLDTVCRQTMSDYPHILKPKNFLDSQLN